VHVWGGKSTFIVLNNGYHKEKNNEKEIYIQKGMILMVNGGKKFFCKESFENFEIGQTAWVEPAAGDLMNVFVMHIHVQRRRNHLIPLQNRAEDKRVRLFFLRVLSLKLELAGLLPVDNEKE